MHLPVAARIAPFLWVSDVLRLCEDSLLLLRLLPRLELWPSFSLLLGKVMYKVDQNSQLDKGQKQGQFFHNSDGTKWLWNSYEILLSLLIMVLRVVTFSSYSCYSLLGGVHKLRLQDNVGMSTFCQHLYHRKCKRRGVGGQKKPKSCQRSLWTTPYIHSYITD